MAKRDSSKLITEAVAYAMSAANYNASVRDFSHLYLTYIRNVPIAKLGGEKNYDKIKEFLASKGIDKKSVEVNTSDGFTTVTLASKTLSPSVFKKLKV